MNVLLFLLRRYLSGSCNVVHGVVSPKDRMLRQTNTRTLAMVARSRLAILLTFDGAHLLALHWHRTVITQHALVTYALPIHADAVGGAVILAGEKTAVRTRPALGTNCFTTIGTLKADSA